MLVLRSALFTIVFYLNFVALMIAGLPVLALPHPVKIRYVRFWARSSLKWLEWICGTRIEFRNRHLLASGGSVLAVKHQSILETMALVTVVDDFTYVLKKELITIPLFGWYLRGTGQIGVDRDKGAGALVRLQRAVHDKLAAGKNVIIFPEGTRRAVNAPPAYKPGVAALCARSEARCTPVALNTGLFWPRRNMKRFPGTVVIEFLPPLDLRHDKRVFMRALQNAIEPATDALVAEAIRQNPDLVDVAPKRPAAPVLT